MHEKNKSDSNSESCSHKASATQMSTSQRYVLITSVSKFMKTGIIPFICYTVIGIRKVDYFIQTVKFGMYIIASCVLGYSIIKEIFVSN